MGRKKVLALLWRVWDLHQHRGCGVLLLHRELDAFLRLPLRGRNI
jgi:hypothetical protein